MTTHTYAYMCKTHFDYELDIYPLEAYPTIEELRENHDCVDECGIVKVEIVFVETVQESNYGHLESDIEVVESKTEGE